MITDAPEALKGHEIRFRRDWIATNPAPLNMTAEEAEAWANEYATSIEWHPMASGGGCTLKVHDLTIRGPGMRQVVCQAAAIMAETNS